MLSRSRRTVAHATATMAALAGLALSTGVAAAQSLRGWHSRHAPDLSAPLSGKGSGLRPHARGVVLFGTRRVASFTTTASGTFSTRFKAPEHDRRPDARRGADRVRGPLGARRELAHWRRAGQVPRKAVEAGDRRRPGGSLRRPQRPHGRKRPHGYHSGRPAPTGPTGSTGTSGATGATGSTGGSGGSHWIPPQHLTWYWQLQGTVNNNEPVAAYDIDGFENSAGEVATLHGQGKHVICYIDVGTAENWRPDSARSRPRCWAASTAGRARSGWTSASSACSSRS